MNQMILASIMTNLQKVLSDGLPIMVAGMMGIFVVIGIIILTISLLGKINCDGNFTRGLKALFGKKD
ncbi:MAG: hypothetical protein IKJ74_06195 [Clostridia bacterium]|nr:hypothetical protein [Clostridia bacterium]